MSTPVQRWSTMARSRNWSMTNKSKGTAPQVFCRLSLTSWKAPEPKLRKGNKKTSSAAAWIESGYLQSVCSQELLEFWKMFSLVSNLFNLSLHKMKLLGCVLFLTIKILNGSGWLQDRIPIKFNPQTLRTEASWEKNLAPSSKTHLRNLAVTICQFPNTRSVRLPPLIVSIKNDWFFSTN